MKYVCRDRVGGEDGDGDRGARDDGDGDRFIFKELVHTVVRSFKYKIFRTGGPWESCCFSFKSEGSLQQNSFFPPETSVFFF